MFEVARLDSQGRVLPHHISRLLWHRPILPRRVPHIFFVTWVSGFQKWNFCQRLLPIGTLHHDFHQYRPIRGRNKRLETLDLMQIMLIFLKFLRILR